MNGSFFTVFSLRSFSHHRQLQTANGEVNDAGDPAKCIGSFYNKGDCKKCNAMLTPQCQTIFSCPAGYYCPMGVTKADNAAAADLVFEGGGGVDPRGADKGIWWPAGGVEGVYCESFQVEKFPEYYAYKCECQLGMWCPANIARPKFCPSRYECTRPQNFARCPAGRYCKEGTVKGLPCKGYQKGTDVPGDGLWVLWGIIASAAAYGAFWFISKYRANKMTKQNQELEDYNDVLKENDAALKKQREEAKATYRASTTSLPTVEGYRIEFEDMRLKLPNGVTIMRGPSGALEPGKTTAIMGASGAGKTTLMNLVTGKVKKTGGRITCNGEEVEDLSRSSPPRWYAEGFFYASTVIPYKKVRYGPTKGDIWLKVSLARMQQSMALHQTFWQSMGWMFLSICCLTLINLFCITTTRLDKKV